MEELAVSGGKRRSDVAGAARGAAGGALGGMEGRREGQSDLPLALPKQPRRKSVSFTEDEAYEQLLKGDLLTEPLGQGRAHSAVGVEKVAPPAEANAPSAFYLRGNLITSPMVTPHAAYTANYQKVPLNTTLPVTAISTAAVTDEMYCYRNPVDFLGGPVPLTNDPAAKGAVAAAGALKPSQQPNLHDQGQFAPGTKEIAPHLPPPPSAASLTTMTASVAPWEERLPVKFSAAAAPSPTAATTALTSAAAALEAVTPGVFYHQPVGCALGGSSGNACSSSGNGAAGDSSIASGGLESSENENDVEESPYFSDEDCDIPLTGEVENSCAIEDDADDADDRAKAWSEAVAANPGSGITFSGSRLRGRRSSWEIGDRYKFVRTLGHGSYGEVAQCEDLVEGGLVAVKRVLNVFDSEVDAKRIYREMYILRNMKHEEIIHLKDVILPDHYDDFTDLYLVFEFVDTDMYKLIGSPQFLTDDHVKLFMYQMLVGLKYLHSAHVIHRDIKPANILVNEDCSLKICDFGLSRVVTQEPSAPPPPGRGCRSTPGKLACSPVKQSSSVKTPGVVSDVTTAAAGDVGGEEACGVDGQDGGGSGLIGGSPDSEDSPPPAQQRQTLKRQLTKHVVTRWYRAPELILLQDYNKAVDVWSLGCIMAELLSMQKESYPTSQERNALFPGKSCFPLSAETPSSYSDALDQLNVIFDVIGTPCKADIEGLGEVRQYLTKLLYKPPLNLAEKYPGASPQALALLALMLRFNPSKRITVDEALEHPYLSSCRSPEREVTASAPITMEFENIWTDKGTLKQLVYQEVLHYHKNQDPLLPSATSCKTPPATPSTRSPSPTPSSVSKKRLKDDEATVDESGAENGSGSALLPFSPSVGDIPSDTPANRADEDGRQLKRQRSDGRSGR